ncbi:vWA domain-containing protein [Acanthopleuribacter pedis]|uniref:VWA domain-containing protein n=1 Tax=Acanthopleuribacter pedis TaxID=442870 RepID=A0A8J7QKR9_9BACT|nr:vWA domain-containing protein [Acanthopleuribacter pedis]MBO1320033.1 VWA domain-containing protein [Acanthopleuribacter pedis]
MIAKPNTQIRSAFAILTAMLLFSAGPLSAATGSEKTTTKPRPKVQVAFLLDTSSSMDGLINQARTHLWDIVNTIATGKRRGVVPHIEIALYEYGNSRLSRSSGYIRQVVPFSQDLDALSEALFALTTNGGDEYCGWVLKEAAGLDWSAQQGVYRSVFIAGNESFEQGSVPYKTIMHDLRNRGIIVNTIFCGGYQDGISQQWLAGAQAGAGQYTVIDQNKAAVQVAAPQDQRLLQLNQALNQTYLAYGARAKKAKERQEKQDDAAGSMGQSAKVERAVAKTSSSYQSAAWDFVGQLADGNAAPMEEAVAAEVADLPEAEREAKAEELKQAAEAKLAERRKIQTEIKELSKERRAFLAKQKNKDKGTMSEAMRTMIQTQMRAAGYQFK